MKSFIIITHFIGFFQLKQKKIYRQINQIIYKLKKSIFYSRFFPALYSKKTRGSAVHFPLTLLYQTSEAHNLFIHQKKMAMFHQNSLQDSPELKIQE